MASMAQLGQLPTILSDSLLSSSPLWNREVKTIKPIDLALFIRLHKNTSNYLRAVREVEYFKNYVMQAHIDDLLPEEALGMLDHDAPQEVFTSGDLVEWLEQTSLARRRALLFALEMDLDPKAVIELTWRDLRGLEMTSLALELVRATVRHIRIPYVFWDTMPNGAAAPLFGLYETALEVSQGLGMSVLRRLYRNMIMLDNNAELESFQCVDGSAVTLAE